VNPPSDDSRPPSDDGTPPPDDADHDGFRVVDGDCDDYEANINPMAFEVADNSRDDDCDGQVDEPPPSCDCEGGNQLPAGLELCDPRFLSSWEQRYLAPSASAGAAVVAHYGSAGNDLAVRSGCGYTVLTNGYVGTEHCSMIDLTDCSESTRQPGFDYTYDGWHYCGEDGRAGEADPSPTGGDGAPICDAHQIVLRLRAPSNANGFSFDFIYLSTEYPEYVHLGYNDTFYAIIDRPSAGERQNISYDDSGNEIEVDNTFFEDPPRTNLAGTGYEGRCTNEDWSRDVCGSSTGWLRTSWSITPNEEFTLTFSIHDEGDGLLDSAVILDNFAWSLNTVEPGTDLI
jgi:hypothetical protein